MFQKNKIVGRQTSADPVRAHKFDRGLRQSFETASELISLAFDYVINFFVFGRKCVFTSFPPEMGCSTMG
jgi:hypothetical protein